MTHLLTQFSMAVFVLLPATMATAQPAPPSYQVRGTLRDSGGAPVSGAMMNYSVQGEDAAPLGAITDSSGDFSFTLHRSGAFYIVPVVGGVIWDLVPITLPQDSARVLDVRVPRCAVTGTCRRRQPGESSSSWPPNKRMDAASAYARKETRLVRLALIRVRSPVGVVRGRVGSQVMR